MTAEYRPTYSPTSVAAWHAAQRRLHAQAEAWGYADAQRGPKRRRTRDRGRYVYHIAGEWRLMRLDGSFARANSAQARILNRIEKGE